MSKASRSTSLFFITSLFLILFCTPLWADKPPRFFLRGDGTLVLGGQSITYRQPDGPYREEGLKKINLLFKAPWNLPEERLSLRFIEVLDFLQDQLGGGSYTLRSGYRSPRLNQSLRRKGKLAAQSSMHKEGAAGDLILGGVPSGKVFEFVKGLNCCGIGWYHTRHFHLDTGPARYWDEKTSKTEDKTPQQNEKIILQSDYDRYRPGDNMGLKFMRITEYPIGVPQLFQLISLERPEEERPVWLPVTFSGDPKISDHCRILTQRSQARKLSLSLPKKKIQPGKYALRVKFCNRYDYPKMPEEILSRPFEIVAEALDH